MLPILLVLLVTTVFLARFGTEDLTGALTYAGRISGALLLLASAVILLGSVAVVDHWFRRRCGSSGMVALFGTVTAASVNALLLVTTVTDGDSIPYLALWCLLMAGSVWASVMVYRSSAVIPAPKRVATAVIISTGIALANFSYTELYQPSHQEASPVIRMAVGQPVKKPDGTAFALPVDITLENHSEVGFYVFGTQFHVMGYRVPLSLTDRLALEWRSDVRSSNPLSRREIHEPGQLVEASEWMSAGQWIEPGGTFATQELVELPASTPYDQLSLYATANLARKDRLGLEQEVRSGYSWDRTYHVPKWQQGKGDYVIYHGRIRENNAIAEHTRDPRYVTLWWVFSPHSVDLYASIKRLGEEDRILPASEMYELNNRYGIVDAVAGRLDQTLWNIKQA
ncbi:hypothetical protein [Peterkaempfera griseoplana]|uniref:hypothetical protein n=1 Tax=Peterkaempfera griseoplana TaxID=66896 RepID=UPI000B18BA1B|nr:hypothetical protein [Peterkaempfera griseoplana]